MADTRLSRLLREAGNVQLDGPAGCYCDSYPAPIICFGHTLKAEADRLDKGPHGTGECVGHLSEHCIGWFAACGGRVDDGER